MCHQLCRPRKLLFCLSLHCAQHISGTFFGAFFVNTAGPWTPRCKQPLYFHIKFSVLNTQPELLGECVLLALSACAALSTVSKAPVSALERQWVVMGGRQRFAFWDEVTIWTVLITTSGSLQQKQNTKAAPNEQFDVTFTNIGADVRTMWWWCSVFNSQSSLVPSLRAGMKVFLLAQLLVDLLSCICTARKGALDEGKLRFPRPHSICCPEFVVWVWSCAL